LCRSFYGLQVTQSNQPRGEPPLVLGGSLHRDPDGRLCTIKTGPPQNPHPRAMQELWSRVSRRRYPASWNGQQPTGTQVIYWTDPITIACGRCRQTRIGTCVAYQVGGAFGVVEQTSREYLPQSNFPDGPPTGDPHTRRERSRAWYKLGGTEVGKASTTTVTFRCRRDHLFTRNMHRLGRQLHESGVRTITLTDG